MQGRKCIGKWVTETIQSFVSPESTVVVLVRIKGAKIGGKGKMFSTLRLWQRVEAGRGKGTWYHQLHVGKRLSTPDS
jgi:hypothetical protein